MSPPLQDAATDATVDAVPTPASYHGTIAQTEPIVFGGPSGGINYCSYTIVLKDIDVQIGILPGGQVATGHVQNINVEEVVQPCTLMPMPQSIATYTFSSATTTSTGMALIFAGAATNKPRVSLAIDLTSASTGYQARLNYHRTDQAAPFDWIVVATTALAAQ